MENLNNLNTTNNTTDEAKAKALILQGYEKSKDFSLVFLGATIISDSRTLSSKVTSVQGGDNGKYDLVAKVKLLQNEANSLDLFKRQAVALCEQNGIKAEGQTLTYLIPNVLLKDTLKGVIEFSKNFEVEVNRICGNFDQIKGEIERKFNQIADAKVRAEALAKIPTKEDFCKRNFFKPNVFPTGGVEETDAELKQLVAETKAKNASSTEDAFLDKAFKPFRDVFDDVQSNIRNNPKFKADEIGRKRSAIGRAIKKVLDIKTCLELVFREGDSKELLDKLFAILPVIYDRFGDVDAKNPVRGSASETEAVKVFYAILENLKSAKEFKDFVQNGGTAATLLGYFDIRNIKGKKQVTTVTTTVAQPQLGKTPELTKEERLKGVEEALAALSGTFSKDENSLEAVFGDGVSGISATSSVQSEENAHTSDDTSTEASEIAQEQVVQVVATATNDIQEVEVKDEQKQETVIGKPLTAEDIYDSLGL